MKPSILFSALAAFFLSLNGLTAQTVATDPVGFVQPFGTSPNCLANSDTVVSVPFTRPPEFVGATTAATANTLTVSGSPWTANQFVYVAGSQPKTYFVLIGPHASSNAKEGRMYQITSNTTNQLTVNNNGDDLSAVAASTQVLVIPYNTLASVFPDSDAGVSYTTSTSQFNPQTQILIPDYSGGGINLSASATYFYLTTGTPSWRKFGESGLPNRNDIILPNAGYFIVRNPASAGGKTLTTLGSVLTKKVTIPLLTRTGGFTDNFASVIRPVDVKLTDLGLNNGAFVDSSGQFSLADQLLVFDPATAQINKSASATYYHTSAGGWRKFPNVDANNDIIPAGAGFIIRKAATAGGAAVYWQNSPTY